MKYWKRAAGALKDRNSIWLASLARRSVYRNSHLETAIIKATSHDETRVDYKNAHRVFAWVRTSPHFLRPLLWTLSTRMERTGSWVVALKGLMLMHGVCCTMIPSIEKIGRLPFDFSNFNDAHSKPTKTWGYNAFVRAYFSFLDQKSSFMCTYDSCPNKGRKKQQYLRSKDKDKHKDKDDDTGGDHQEPPVSDDLDTLQKLQYLFDLLLQVKPQDKDMSSILVLEAMDCIIIEIFDVYNKIWTYITRVSSRIHVANRYEAAFALKLLQQANTQAEEMSRFFEFCMLLGVVNASEFPKIDQVAEEDIQEVKGIIDALWEQKSQNNKNNEEHSNNNVVCNEKAIVERPSGDMRVPSLPTAGRGRFFTTVVTDKWEIFEDDDETEVHGGSTVMDSTNYYDNVSNISYKSTPTYALAIVPQNASSYSCYVKAHKEELPDLISF